MENSVTFGLNRRSTAVFYTFDSNYLVVSGDFRPLKTK